MPGNYFDQFDSEKTANFFDQFDAPVKPRGAVAEIANQLKAGTIVDLPRMVGQAAQYTSEPGRGVYEWGREVADAAEVRGQRPDLQPDTASHNGVTNALASGARMIPSSVAPAILAGGALATLPVSGSVALGGAALLGAVPAGLSQGQQTLDKAAKAGVPDEEARVAARKTAAIEGLGEAAGTYLGGKLLGVAGKPIAAAFAKPGEAAAAQVLKEATGKSVVKPFLRQLPETVVGEVGTEMAQNAGEAYVERNAGIDKQAPWDAAKEAIAPTLGMTALLAPFGLAGHGIRARQASKRAEVLADGAADPEVRAQVAAGIQGELAKVNPQAAANFGLHADAAIKGKQKLDIGEGLFTQPEPVLQLGNTPDPLVSFADGTVGRQSEVEAYLASLPEDQRSAARVKLMGLAPQPADVAQPEPVQPAPPPAVGYSPLAGTPVIFPDGSMALNSEAADAKRFAPQPVTPEDRAASAFKQSQPEPAAQPGAEEVPTAMQHAMKKAQAQVEAAKPLPERLQAMGIQPTGGPLQAAATIAVATGAHDVSVAQQLDAAAAEDAAKAKPTEKTAAAAPAAPLAPIEDAAHAAATSPLNELPEPTQAQKEAGNYLKGHTKIAGLDLSIENPEGSTRSGTSPDGTKWSNTLAHHYGYLRGTVGNDKEHIDAFVKPGTAEDFNGSVFVIDQVHPDTGRFDEHKVILGAKDAAEAQQIYQANYAPDWKGGAAITEMPMSEFKAWVKDGAKTEPANAQLAATEANLKEQTNGSKAAEAVETSPQRQEAPAGPANEPSPNSSGGAQPAQPAAASTVQAAPAPAKPAVNSLQARRTARQATIAVQPPSVSPTKGTAAVEKPATAAQTPTGKVLSTYTGKYQKGMAASAAQMKARELNKAGNTRGIVYTAEEHNNPALEHPYAVVGRKGDGTQFARMKQGETGEGVHMADANAAVAGIREALPTSPPIHVLESADKAPEDLLASAKRAGAEADWQAAYSNGEIYVVPSRIASLEELVTIVANHEIRHHGLRAMLGPRLGQTMLAIHSSNPNVREAAAKVIADGHAKSRVLAVEEALADMPAADLQKLNGWGKVVAAVRQWLRHVAAKLRRLEMPTLAKVFEPSQWTDNDVAALVARAEGVSKGGSAPHRTGGTVFSRGHASTLQREDMAFGDLSADQEAAVKDVLGVQKVPTVKERAQALKANLGLRLNQGIFDAFAPIKNYSQEAYMQARLSKGSDGTLEAAMLYGKPFLRDGVPDVDVKDGGFANVLASLKGEHDRFLLWVAAQRAEKLKAEGKENLFTDKNISTLKTLNAGRMTDGKPRAFVYGAALTKLNEFNDAVLKVAQESGLLDKEAVDLFKGQPYLPFYRALEEGNMKGPKFSAGLVNQQAYKKLQGGKSQLNADLLENMLLNWSHLYTAAARNRAALEAMTAAEKAAVAYRTTSDAKGSVRILRDGNAEHWMVEDPYLMEAITSLSYVPPPLIKPLAAMKKLLTFSVTINPAFKIRNLVRDSLSAIAQSDLSYNPAKNVAEGWKATAKGSQTYASMLAGGGVMKFGTSENSDRVREDIAKLGGKLADKEGMAKLGEQFKTAYEAYKSLGDRLENVNRAALYDRLVKDGHSHAEANFMARDLLDFSMSGRYDVVRFLAQTVPFLNARLQGLHKLGRAAKEDPQRMAIMAGAVSMASLALLAAYSGDPDWEKREDFDRDSYWFFKIGNQAYRIPKPFELGAVGTLAERTAELMFTDKLSLDRYGQRLGFMLGQTFALDPTPQIVKPLIDVYANRDSFTGRAIETQADQKLQTADRFNERTSEVARMLGSWGLPDPVALAKADYKALSPKQIDELLRGYFGWMSTLGTTISDFAARPLMGRGERPSMQLRDVFLAGNFVENLPTGSSRYTETMYNQARQIDEAYASYRNALKLGDTEKAAEIKEKEGDKLKNHMLVAAAERQMTEINAMVKRVEASRMLSGEAKRAKLDELAARRNAIAERVAQRVSG